MGSRYHTRVQGPHTNVIPHQSLDAGSYPDALSQGRVLLGVGTGWIEEELRDLGAAWQQRGRRLDETMQVRRNLWSDEARFVLDPIWGSASQCVSCGFVLHTAPRYLTPVGAVKPRDGRHF